MDCSGVIETHIVFVLVVVVVVVEEFIGSVLLIIGVGKLLY